MGFLRMSTSELRLLLLEAAREASNEPVAAWEAMLRVGSAAPDTATVAPPSPDTPPSPRFSDALAGGISPDLVKPEQGIPADQDHLDMSTYVGMLAAVIARRDTPLPVSIGLFGEWGSGKSYFMGLMRDRVDTLKHSTSAEYCHDIVQIGFNAWSYADTNLWASLGDEIFRQLAGPAASSETDKRPDELRKELRQTMQRAQELQAAKEKAEQEATQLHAELAKARGEYSQSLKALVRATVEEVGGVELDGVWSTLGVTDPTEQVDTLTEQAQGARTDLRTARQITANKWARVSAVVGALGILALLTVPFLGEQASAIVARTGGAALTAACVTLAVIVRKVAAAVRKVQGAASSIRSRIAEDADARVAVNVAAVRQAQAREQVLQAQLDEVLVRAGELGRELVDINPGQRLYSFLGERAASADYRGQLGLISTIRRDFQQLIQLMDRWRANPDDTACRPIDRIVLYIDDLDRCAPPQVVDVLQAVHLLLALDLFVVVVGVDPRWLLHSLRDQYRRVLAMNPDSDERTWISTPTDYLEKIFNIPFVLPPMTSEGFGHLLERLAGSPDEPAPTEKPLAAATASDTPTAQTAPVLRRVPPESSTPSTAQPLLTAEATSEVGRQTPAGTATELPVALPPRPLTRPELDLLSALSPMVGTPREAKRLLNLYRMLRSTRDLSNASRFIGTPDQPGEYQAAAVLLALLTAFPRLVGELLAAPADPEQNVAGGLCNRPTGETTAWAQFVASLEPQQCDGSWRNAVSARMDNSEREEWAQLVQAACQSAALVKLADLTAFCFWGPHVARFSFVLSNLNSESAPTD